MDAVHMSRFAVYGIIACLVFYGVLMLAILKMAAREPWWETTLLDIEALPGGERAEAQEH